jgi:NhaA family Na+:H+ antiporter
MTERDNETQESGLLQGLSQPWARSPALIPTRVVRPLERFLHLEAGSASLLMVAAVVALVWVNLDAGSYERVWDTPVDLDVGPVELHEDLRHIVNDLLMAVFFYVVALEIKREMLFGSLRDRRSALVPTMAALGTIVGGALAYVAVNLIADGDLSGWAIPAATDIAFALGALGLVGRRAPRPLRAFMLTLAVVDDLATIAVIAVFFSADISLWWLLTAVAIMLAIVVARRSAVRSLVPYVVLAGALWYAVLESGIHATIAGVVLGFVTPAVAFHRRRTTAEAVRATLAPVERGDDDADALLLEISRVSAETVSPLARMETRLHPWSAYVVLPIFALANAGVPVSLDALSDAFSSPVGLGILIGLVIGAPLGGIAFAWSVLRSGQGRLPEGLAFGAVTAVTPLKGIGFTVAIFISALALDTRTLQDQAKLAILIGSLTAAVIGITALLTHHRIADRA